MKHTLAVFLRIDVAVPTRYSLKATRELNDLVQQAVEEALLAEDSGRFSLVGMTGFSLGPVPPGETIEDVDDPDDLWSPLRAATRTDASPGGAAGPPA